MFGLPEDNYKKIDYGFRKTFRVSGFFACSIASEYFSSGNVESIIESTETIPVASASIAGLNNPQREPINVISLTTVGVRSRLSLDAIVDFNITVPRGLINFSV